MDFISRGVRRLSQYDTFIVPALFTFVAGNLLLWAIPDFPLLQGWVLLPFFVLLVLLVIYSQKKWVIRSAFWFAVLVIGGFYYQQFSFQPDEFDLSFMAPHPKATVEGVVLRRDDHGHKGQIRVLNVNGQYASGITQITRTREAFVLPSVGSTALFYGNLKTPNDARFPGGFSYKNYLKTNKITTILTAVTDITLTHSQPMTFQDRINRWMMGVRDKMSRVFGGFLHSPDSDVLSGIVLGSHAVPIDAPTKQAFIQTGLIHFLAASGLNVGIIAGFILWLCGLIKIIGRPRLFIAMAGVALYIMLAGVSPSVLRAGCMLELALFFKLIDQKLSLLFLLGLAISVMVLFNPDVVGSLGFQFSVLSTLGLITMVPPLQEWLGYYMTRRLSGLILVPLIAQIWVLPLSLYHFNQFPIHSVFLNILAILFVTPLTIIGFTSGILGLLWEPLGQGVSILAWPFLKGLLWIVQGGNQLEWAKLTFASPPLWLVPTLYFLLGLMLLFIKKPMFLQQPIFKNIKIMVLLALVFGIVGSFVWVRWEEGQKSVIHLLPLSKSRSALLLKPKFSDSIAIMIPGSLSYWEERTLSDYLKHRNINHLSAIAVWNPVSDAKFKAFKDAKDSELTLLLKNRSVEQFIDLNGLKPNEKLRFGNLTIASLTHQTNRFFQVSGDNFCLLATQQHSDTFLCPFTYFITPHQRAQLWSLGAKRSFKLDTLRTLKITSKKLELI